MLRCKHFEQTDSIVHALPFSFLSSLRRAALIFTSAIAAFSHAATLPGTFGTVSIKPDNPYLFYGGRIARDEDDKQVTMGWSGAQVCLRFKGTAVTLQMTDDTHDNYIVAWVDGKPLEKIRLDSPDGIYPLATDLKPGEHTVEVVRATECFLGLTHFKGFTLDATGVALPWTRPADRRIQFIGDSITCGYGVEVNDPKAKFSPSTENFCESYTGLTVRTLRADYLVVARSGIGMVRNYDGPFEGSTDTMPAVYPKLFYHVEDLLWNPQRFSPQVICINLGTNDFSTTGVNQEKFVSTYIDFAGKLAADYPESKLVLLQGPMDNSEALAAALKRIQYSLGEKYPNRVTLFALSPQGEVGYGADYHPNREQSRRNAAELTAYLAKLMDWR